MLKNIKTGKLYYNTNSAHTWDEIVCAVEVDAGYVEFYYLARPNRGLMYVLPVIAMEQWKEIDEASTW